MPTVYVRDGESLTDAIRRFSEKCEREHIKADYTKHIAFKSAKQTEREAAERKRRRHKHKNET